MNVGMLTLQLARRVGLGRLGQAKPKTALRMLFVRSLSGSKPTYHYPGYERGLTPEPDAGWDFKICLAEAQRERERVLDVSFFLCNEGSYQPTQNSQVW